MGLFKVAFAVTLLALAASVGAAPPVPPVPPAPKPLTFDALLLTAEALPADVKLVDGVHPVSIQPNTFYEMPDMQGLLPTPVHKAAQSFAKGDRRPGTVYLFEYEDAAAIAKLRGFLDGSLYGGDGRSAEHPEEVVAHGAFLFILSFPRGDPAAEWWKERLRKDFRIPAERDRPELIPLGRKVYAALEAGDLAASKKLLAENADAFADFAFGHYLLAETALKVHDMEFAEEHYRKALELHDAFIDPLSPPIVWCCHDGIGGTLIARRRYAEALKAFTTAKEMAPGAAIENDALGSCIYNIACCQARLKKFDLALAALKEAIEVDASWKEKAMADEDLAEAVKRKEFKALLAK